METSVSYSGRALVGKLVLLIMVWLKISWFVEDFSSNRPLCNRRILWIRKSFQVHITWHGQQQHSAINPTLNVTQACQCPRVYVVCSYRMPVEIHTIAIYSIYYDKLKLQAEPCLHVFYVCVMLNSAFIYKLNLKCVFNDVVWIMEINPWKFGQKTIYYSEI